MNLFKIFSKYHEALPFPEGVIDDGERQLDCSEAEHLLSCTKIVTTGTIYFYSQSKIQFDYFKSKKANFVVVTRDLSKKRDEDLKITVIPEKEFLDDYRVACNFPDSVTILFDAYNKKPKLEEV